MPKKPSPNSIPSLSMNKNDCTSPLPEKVHKCFCTEDGFRIGIDVCTCRCHRTRKQPTDQQLIEAVAEKVMEWTDCGDCWHYRTEDGVAGTWEKHSWRPLIDWNHTMKVVEKMKKPLNFLIKDDLMTVTWWEKEDKLLVPRVIQDKDPQRAIILAALQC